MRAPANGAPMNTLLTTSFARLGARVQLERWTGAPTAVRPRYRGLIVDVLEDERGQYFTVCFDPMCLRLDVLDVQPAERHLLLAARCLDGSAVCGVLCGHDVYGWYVAAVGRDTELTTVDAVFAGLRA